MTNRGATRQRGAGREKEGICTSDGDRGTGRRRGGRGSWRGQVGSCKGKGGIFS